MEITEASNFNMFEGMEMVIQACAYYGVCIFILCSLLDIGFSAFKKWLLSKIK